MPYNSNALLKEQPRSRPVESHPHAEVLAAFAQERLQPGDSEKVLAHLSRCADCRALLRVTTSAPRPEPVEKTAPPPRPPSTPTAAAAPKAAPLSRGLPRIVTGIVLVGLGALVMLYHRHSPTPETMETEIAAPAAQGGTSPGALTPSASSPTPTTAKTQSVKAGSADAAHSSAQPASAHATPAQTSQPGTVTAGHAAASPKAGAEAATATPAKTKVTATDTLPPLPEGLAVSPGEPVQTSQPSEPLSPPASSSAEGTAGEAAHPGALGSHPGGLTARPQWRIGDSGQVERSSADGVWQQVFDPRAKLHVVAAVGSVVWAGGEDLHLYRSRDNGATWGRIELPVKDGGNSAIEHIRFDNSHEGTVESDNGNSWATTDGGSTWH